MTKKVIKFPSGLATLGRETQQKVLKEALETPDPADTIEWADTVAKNAQKWIKESEFFKWLDEDENK